MKLLVQFSKKVHLSQGQSSISGTKEQQMDENLVARCLKYKYVDCFSDDSVSFILYYSTPMTL